LPEINLNSFVILSEAKNLRAGRDSSLRSEWQVQGAGVLQKTYLCKDRKSSHPTRPLQWLRWGVAHVHCRGGGGVGMGGDPCGRPRPNPCLQKSDVCPGCIATNSAKIVWCGRLQYIADRHEFYGWRSI